jgi:hypothetical protein
MAADYSPGLQMLELRIDDRRLEFFANDQEVGFARWWYETTAIDPLDPAGSWHHVAITHNGTTGTHQIYIDGAAVAQTVVTENNSDIWFNRNTLLDNFLIGAREVNNSGVPINHWDGKIDEVFIYDRDLSAAEISTIYNL